MITTLNGSMQEQLKNLDDNSIDLLLTDPPYNISNNGAKPEWIDSKTGKNKNSIHNQRFSENFEEDWDSVTHDVFLKQLEDWSECWYPKIRKGGAFAVFISDQYISYLWKIMEKTGFEPKRIFTWKKPAAVPFNRKVNPVSGCEYILWGIKPGGQRTFNSDTAEGSIIDRYALADKISSIVYKMIKNKDTNQSLHSLMSDATKEAHKMMNSRKIIDGTVQAIIPNTITFSGGTGEKIHPTQKPVEILKYFIHLLTNENDTVLDTFAGSGSTGIACRESNRNCILIEKDSKMFEKMSKQFDKNNSLFES